MATGSTRLLWKGAISFGLVHVPIGLHTATRPQGIDFDWLDKRTMDPVGYKRINKRTGKEIDKANITKGIEVEDGQYVVLTPDEVAAAYPAAAQTIEIERFVDASEIPFLYLERPYYVTPINKGLKVYLLLRDALQRSGKIGLAKVVIQTRQHLAALVPSGKLLVLNLLRWGNEIRSQDEVDLPDLPARSSISAAEMKMATQLIEEMSGPFDPADFTDQFQDSVKELVRRKVGKGHTETVHKEVASPRETGDNVVDLTALLRRSLKGQSDQDPATPVTDDTAKAAAPKRRARKPAAKPAAKKKKAA